jgi:hypothetical protein
MAELMELELTIDSLCSAAAEPGGETAFWQLPGM